MGSKEFWEFGGFRVSGFQGSRVSWILGVFVGFWFRDGFKVFGL